MEKTLKIEGMVCGNCVRHVDKALREIQGVERVEVSLEDKSAKVQMGCTVSDDVLKAAIEDAGYQVVEDGTDTSLVGPTSFVFATSMLQVQDGVTLIRILLILGRGIYVHSAPFVAYFRVESAGTECSLRYPFLR